MFSISILEKLGLILTGIFSLLIILWALSSMVIGFQESDLIGFTAGLVLLIMGIAIEAFIIRIFKKTVYLDLMVTSAFEEGLYSKLEPVISEIAQLGVSVENFENRMDKISFKLEELGKKKESPAGSANFTIKSIFVLNLTLAAIVFLSFNPLAGTHFILTGIYLVWWFLITSEFRLYNAIQAWYFCFGIIILVPMLTIILNAVFNLKVMMALLFFGIAVFAISYYTWCAFITRGELPFNIHNELKYGLSEIQKKELGRK